MHATRGGAEIMERGVSSVNGPNSDKSLNL